MLLGFITLHLQHNKRASRGLKSTMSLKLVKRTVCGNGHDCAMQLWISGFLQLVFFGLRIRNFSSHHSKHLQKLGGAHLGQKLWGSHWPDTLRPPPKLTLNPWSQCLLGTRPPMPEPNSHWNKDVFTGSITFPCQPACFRSSCMI